jgi:hypothetical protein
MAVTFSSRPSSVPTLLDSSRNGDRLANRLVMRAAWQWYLDLGKRRLWTWVSGWDSKGGNSGLIGIPELWYSCGATVTSS